MAIFGSMAPPEMHRLGCGKTPSVGCIALAWPCAPMMPPGTPMAVYAPFTPQSNGESFAVMAGDFESGTPCIGHREGLEKRP